MFPSKGYSPWIVATAACGLSLAAGARAFGQVRRQSEAAFGSWRDDKPGIRRLLRPEDLPAMAAPTYGLAHRGRRADGPISRTRSPCPTC